MTYQKFLPLVTIFFIFLACNQLIPQSTPTQHISTSTSTNISTITSTNASTPSLTSTIEKLYFTFHSNANCRQGPSINDAVITTIPRGESVEIQEQSEDNTWYYIFWDTNSVSCWVSESTGTIDGNSVNTVDGFSTKTKDASDDQAAGEDPTQTTPGSAPPIFTRTPLPRPPLQLPPTRTPTEQPVEYSPTPFFPLPPPKVPFP